jgi:8-oxo-dGTP pyrophosphatase MutT (NUDIX family)
VSAAGDGHCRSAVRPEWVSRLTDAVGRLPAEHEIEALRPPRDGTGRLSAVLIALSDVALSDTENGPGVLLIERATGLRNHSGQVAFPGGSVEAADADATATALREAHEEVGLDVSSVEILTVMPQRYIPRSTFVVTPVLAWWARPHPILSVDEREVARAVVVALDELADPVNRFRAAYGDGLTGVAFQAGGLFIWGFTAGLLDQLLRLGGWERAWNAADVRPLPASVRGVAP